MSKEETTEMQESNENTAPIKSEEEQQKRREAQKQRSSKAEKQRGKKAENPIAEKQGSSKAETLNPKRQNNKAAGSWKGTLDSTNSIKQIHFRGLGFKGLGLTHRLQKRYPLTITSSKQSITVYHRDTLQPSWPDRLHS